MEIKFEIKDTINNNHEVRFSIDHQTFALRECKSDNKIDSYDRCLWYISCLAPAFYRSFNSEYKRELIRALKKDDWFSFSRIAEMLKISVNEVRNAFIEKIEVHKDDDCIFVYCPDPETCKNSGCKSVKK